MHYVQMLAQENREIKTFCHQLLQELDVHKLKRAAEIGAITQLLTENFNVDLKDFQAMIEKHYQDAVQQYEAARQAYIEKMQADAAKEAEDNAKSVTEQAVAYLKEQGIDPGEIVFDDGVVSKELPVTETMHDEPVTGC